MEIAWLVVAVLVVIAAVMGWQWLDARNSAGKVRAELEQTRERARQAEKELAAAHSEIRAARDELARLKPAATPPDTETRTTAADEAPTGAAAPATQVRQAVKPDAAGEEGTESTQVRPAATQKAPAATVLFVAPEANPPEDPNQGLPYLAVAEGDGDEQIHHLTFDRVTAGRGDDNDIVLADQNTSRQHFTVSFTGTHFLLEDNDSTNGTRCNGERTSRKLLEFGDRIEAGNTTIRFSCEGYDLKDQDADKAVAALEACVARQPDFVTALKLLAFMLERNVARKKEAASHWERIARLEASS